MDQKLYRRIIERSGLVEDLQQFTLAEDALEYLRRMDRPKIDAILLDIRMPRMDGFEFLDAATAEFGQTFTRIAVIMLTTSASEADKQRASEYGFVRDYITKPLLIEHLELVDRLLAEH